MKPATFFICAFLVLFQFYCGAYASGESADSSDSDASSTSFDTVIEYFEQAIEAKAETLETEAYDKLIAAADFIKQTVQDLNEEVESSTYLSNFADELNELGLEMIDGSYRDSTATAALIEAIISLLETNAVTDLEILKALIDALIDLLDYDEVSSDSSLIEIIQAKLLKAIKIIYDAIINEGEDISSALISLVTALNNAVSVETSTTTNITEAWITLFKAIVNSTSD